MSEPTQSLPRKILLATDLSGRGDRALDRSVLLANRWDAELVVVHALGPHPLSGAGDELPSWRRPPDMSELVERQIREDLREAPPRLRVAVDEGEPLKVILDAVEREAPDLLVVALGHGRLTEGLSRTVDELFRRAPVSMLVVKKRPNGPYGHILVGTDFTPEAMHGLEETARLFPDAGLAVMHAYELPYRSFYDPARVSADSDQAQLEALRAWLAQANLDDEARRHVMALVEQGPAERMLSAYAFEKRADLTVIGAYERGRLFHMVVGGKGPAIVQNAPGDVLVVRARRT